MSPKAQRASVAVREAKSILKFLRTRKKDISPLLILAHDFPDPDALGSAFALQYLAREAFGIQSRIVYGGVIGRMENQAMVQILKLPVHRVRAADFKKHAHTALIDTQPNFANNSFPAGRKATLVVDQHPSVSDPVADLAIVDTGCGATSVLMAQTLLIEGLEIPTRVATALAYGISSDTMNLYRARRADVFQTYMAILPFCDMRVLARIQNPPRSRRYFSTLQKGVHNARVKRRLIVSHHGSVDNPDLVSQIADFLLTFKGMKWAFCTGRFKDRLHVSLRISSEVGGDAGVILRDIFDSRDEAGGHGVIAGGSFRVDAAGKEAPWALAEKTIVTRLMKRLKIGGKGDFYYPFQD